MTATVLFLGQRMRPLEPIAFVGDLLGMGRTAAFKASGAWPLSGDKGGRLVIVPALADQLGIPYEIVNQEEGS